MNAKNYLRQVEKLNKMIENKMAELEQWKAVAFGTTANMDGERVQSSGSKQKMADAVGRYVDLENEINSDIDNLIDTRKEVIRTIEQLPADMYDVLHKLYIQGMELQEIAGVKRISYSNVTTIHGRALKELQLILDGRRSKEMCTV